MSGSAITPGGRISKPRNHASWQPLGDLKAYSSFSRFRSPFWYANGSAAVRWANHDSLFAHVDGTTWPTRIGDTGWALRYAPDSANHLHAASIVSAYAHLTDPEITQKDAIEALKRARKAARRA